MRSFIMVFLFCPVVLAGDVFLQPPGLTPGDEYRLVFTTSKIPDTFSEDVTFYDEFVQSVADNAPTMQGWDVRWRAIFSSPEVDARDHIDANAQNGLGVPIYRVDGELFAGDYWDLFFQSSTIPGARPPGVGRLAPLIDLNVSELGDPVPAELSLDDEHMSFGLTQGNLESTPITEAWVTRIEYRLNCGGATRLRDPHRRLSTRSQTSWSQSRNHVAMLALC